MALTKVRTGGLTDDAVTTDKLYTPNLGRRNIVINGAMQVAQRSTSETVGASTGYFTLDRFKVSATTDGRATMSQDSDAPNGFGNSLKFQCTTADTSISANDIFSLNTRFEGQDLQRFKKGTSDAEKMTISFYVKANASATYVFELYDIDNARQISQSFSVTTSWNRVTLTFDGDTTGAFGDDNGSSLIAQIWLHGGSTYTSGTLSTSWSSVTNANRAVGISSFFDSTDRTFFITGLQMEVGSAATPFEHRSFGEELTLCQRYYQKAGEYSIAPSNGSNSTSFSSFSEPLGNCVQWGGTPAGHCPIYLPVRMRVKPTVVRYGNSSGYLGYIASGGSSPTSDNVLAFHQNLFFTAQTEQMIGINNQVTGSTIWGVFGGWTADAEL